ncbi:LPD23 domain-containing protein [Victivallis lenta]|uniref:LPD23 domain-containing protein n=1 Tax=Victivallis lenta TaxID=2606640 RepID=UPI003AF1F2B7
MAIKITKNGTAGAQDRAPAAKTYQEGSSQGKASGRIKITKIERPQTAAKQKWTVGNIGQYGAGNIDLYDRPQYRNANGSISTVDSTSYNIDGQEVLLPTVWNRNGTPYHSSNDEEILQRYRDTGEYLGKFSTVEEANDYAEKLHLEQQERYPSSSLPAERGSKHKSGKEISQSIVRNEDAAKRIGATVRATAQNLGANASGFLAALVAAAEEMDKEYRDAKEKAGVTTHADEMNPYPKTNEEITRGNRAGIDLLEGIADTQRAKAAENIRTAKEGLGTAGRVGIDAFQIGMNLAGIVGANAILPGLGTAALGVSSGGSMANDYRQAQGENYNPLAGAGLAIGGAASVGVGGAAAKGAIRYGGALLNKLGLGNSAIAQNVLGALSDIAFAGGMSATNEYAKAAAYGDSYEDVAISGEELAKDMLFQAAVGFFCRTLASSLGGKAEGATAQKAQREYFKDIDNLDDLTKAFKQYGRQYHPDRFTTADAATQREMNDLFAKISAEYNAVKAELAVETAGRAAKAYSEQRTAKTPEAAQKAQATVKDEIAVMRSLVESGVIQAKEAVEAVQILDALAGEQTVGEPENPTADTAPERAAGTSESAPMPTSEEIGNQQAAQNSSPAQGADHSRQRVGGTVAPLGVSATQESRVSITPVGGKSKSDPLTQGKRVSLLQYANEGNAAEISERLNRGELAVDANGDLYRPKAEEHIDQRDSNTVGERRIKAFQFDHPEVHSFYKEAAANLMEELNYAEKGGGIVKLKEHGAGDDQYIRMKRSASERIAKLLDDEDISYADIERSISAIINDKGQENFAAAKRVELMLDNMLSNGYRDVHGGYHEPNADYLEAKQSIPGASETAATHEELPLWDIEEKNGGATHGTEIKPAEPAEEGGADAVGAQSDLHGGDGGRRPYGDGAGGAAQLRQQPKSGSIERLHENVRRNRARTGSERSKENGALIQARQDAAALEPLVSSAEVGVSLGTDTKMLHILPRNAWDQELLDVEAAAKQAGISEVVMVTGLLQVNGGGSPVSITGVAERETNRIVMRVDSRKKTASELGLHEIAHFRSTRENVEAFAAAVQDSGDGWRDTLEEYRERYKGAANNYEGMTPEDADLYVWEEIMGDAYAGIDCFGQTASQYHTEAVRAIDGGSGATPAQEAQRTSSAIQKETSAASDRKTGPPARFSYAGKNANGANLDSLREAQEMQAAGADMESIRKATGWHEGMDGKWRWEIDDSKMEYHRAGDALFGRNHPEYAEQQRLEQKMLYGEMTDTEQARLRALTETWGRERSRLSERVERGNARLEDVLDHEELFRAYPQLRHVRVVFDETPKGVLGSFSAEGNQITISEELRDAPQDVLIHEIQHAIQNAEGFAKGSNRQYWEEKLTNGDEIQSKGFQEAREKLIQFQLDEANEEVLALRDQLEKAGELDDGFREYDRIWEEAERRGLDKKINEYYDLRENYYDQLHKPQRSVPSELYYNTAGEIEARDAANRRPMSSETRKRIKPDYGNGDTVFANGEDSYSVGETDDGRAVAVVDNDILSHIDTSTWDSAKKAQAKAAAKTALLAFEDGIQVNGITYKVNRTSRREYTRSEDTERLARRTPDAFADKMRAADIADDIITATTSWAKDGKLKHPRRDSFVDFAHGDVLIQAGANQYDAETVVGITADGEYVFYDVVDMTPTSFTTKKEPSPTAAGNNASSDIQESSSERSISRSTEKSNREISGVQPLSLPTLEPTTKTRFSLDEPVEETETLVAMHNMTEEKLRRTLDIGAWPSPSIAVVKAKEGHANYGEYSAVFPRGTIDLQVDSKNKVYGGDAWTPTHDNAIVERGVNYEARRAFDDRIKDLSSQFAGGVFQGSGTLGKIGLENDTRWEPEEIADKLANHPEVQAAFLQSEGKSLEPVYRDKQFDRFFSNATIQRYLDAVGEQEVARLAVKLMTGERLTAEEMKPAEQAIREVYAEEHANFLNRRPESKEKRIDYYMKNNVFPNRVEDFIRSTQEFYESGGSAGEIDKEATAAKMMEMIAPGGSWNDAPRTVKDWVQPQLEGLLGERGIYNGKDAVTDRGRRSFAETHWDYTAENIVKAMNMAAAKGANVYGITPETLAATATQEYKTVDEMHADEARLRTVSEEEHAKALRDLGIYLDRVVNDLMLTTMHKYDNSFEEEQNLSGIIAEAAKGKKTTAAVKAAFRKEGYAISDGHAKSILALIDRAANIPTGYYEAKPQRVVGFDEALAVVAPDNAPADLLGEMRNAGMNVVEYKAGDEADRLAKVNSIEKARFSVDEDGGILPDDERDKWENTRLTPEQKEQLERARARARGDAPRMQDFDNVDDYFAAMRQRAEAERKKRMRNVPKEEFEGTEALQDLGIKIENSAGLYQNVEQMIENDKAAKKIQREIRRAEKRLSVTPKEKSYAAGIAAGIYDADDIPSRMNASKVMELADYYTAEQAMKSDTIPMQRQDISQNLRAQAAELFKDTGNDTFKKKYEKALFSPKGGLALYHRTPQRSMRAIFGWEQGQKINEAIFEPVYVNEQERKRFVNRMHDEVRRFEDKNGKQTALTEKERALTQLVIEGKAVAELVAASDMKEQLIHAAENLKAGGEMADVSQEFGLHDKEARDLARRYADWLQTQEDLAGTDVDQTKVEHAVEAYRTLYDKFYKAINHFLVAHGYEPIGFIKGYAPHFQPEAESGKLEKALKSIGVDLGAEAGSLPASIAGLTKAFKPNKRYNPFFQHRAGKSTEYDVEKGFEKYVDYLSDVLYHTDDIMRVRAAVKYFREEYGPDEISAEISRAESLRFAPKEAKESFLKSAGLLTNTSDLSYADLSAKMEEYVEGLFDSIKKTSKYSDLTVWLDDYANKLAGKQLFSDRDMEREVGRTSLNVGRKLNKMFARANVAGNLSSSLNQTAQLPMIAGEIGPKYVIKAVNDIIAGKTKGDFADQSDFLTEKNGIDYLTNDKGSKITSALFWPLERMDYLISSIAVRGKYRKELDAGRSPKEAMKAADRWARDIMGTRSKGAAPLTFQSKNLIAQIVNMFQVEALNSWEHVTQDLFGPGLKEAEAKLGKEEAAKRLAGIIVATLLGAFLLNRVAEEGYGGTPAQFDVIGLLVGFLASGNGLSTNEQIATWIDDAWENGTGERLFGTDANAGNDEFDAGAATEDTLYNVSNDIPYLRNAAGLLGLGDQTLPMPDIYGTVTGTAKAVKDNGPFSEEVMRQLMGLAGDTLPGGRQAEKTYQGIETLLKGGYYKGSGEDERLQYPVSEDFWNVVQATMFGRNALSETRDFYAAGGKGLSAAQTRLYKQLVDMGADNETVYDAILAWKKIDGNEALSKAERETARFELVQSLPLTSEERELLHNTLSGSDTKYSAADEAKAQGIPVGTYQKFQADAAALESDRDKDGNVIRNSKKEKVLKLIDSLPLNKAQKDWLYLNEGYAESKLDETPWQ